MSFDFANQRPRRKPSLTPMIDVVFLLLVFFMLAARFGHDFAITLKAGGGAGEYSGPPRLVRALPEGVLLNGIGMKDEDLAVALTSLTETSEDIIVLQADQITSTQRIVDILIGLDEAGFSNVALVE